MLSRREKQKWCDEITRLMDQGIPVFNLKVPFLIWLAAKPPVCGMDYAKRDEFDLYYNMLLQLVAIKLEHRVDFIKFGHTGEDAKCLIGCDLDERHMIAFSNNALTT